MRGRAAFVGLLLLVAGCGSHRRNVLPKVPPLPAPVPGIYADVTPRYSHDGKRIAFLRATPDRQMQLYVVDEDLERPLALMEPQLLSIDRPYHATLAGYSSPESLAWSPNDREIAFERTEWFSFEEGELLPGSGIWSFDTYTGRVAPLATHPDHYLEVYYYYHSPQWSPDSRYLAFVGEGINGQHTLYVRTLRGQKPEETQRLFDVSDDSDWPAWEPRPLRRVGSLSPDGIPPGLAYRRGINRSTYSPNTEVLRRLCPGSVEKRSCGQIWKLPVARYTEITGHAVGKYENVAPRFSHLVWSPDGEHLAFTMTPDARDLTRAEIWVIRRDGTEARRISPTEGHGYFAPVWIGNDALGALSPRSDLYAVVTIGLRSHTARMLGLIDTADCDWSPDRTRIIYATPHPDTPVNGNLPTTLRLFETHLGDT